MADGREASALSLRFLVSKKYNLRMADELQAVLTSQLGERQARLVYAAVLETALHLREALASAASAAPGIEAETSPEELLQARLRNAARAQALRDRLLEGALGGSQLARQLGISNQAIDQARRADKVVALRSGGSWRYPVWQFDFSAPDPLPPHLSEVAEAAGGFRLAVARWLSAPDEVLGEPPLETLRTDRWQTVVQRARQLFITAT